MNLPELIILIAHQMVKRGNSAEHKKVFHKVGAWKAANPPETASQISSVTDSGKGVRVVHPFPGFDR
jgi:hypothetical protein